MDAQADAFGSRFDRIQQNLDLLATSAEVTTDPSEVTPERVLVFETLVTIDKFAEACRRLGFEWLAELVGTDEDDQWSRVYVTVPDERSLRSMLALWKRYAAKESRPNKREGGKDGEWWDLFAYLKEIRTWSAQDRVDPGLFRYLLKFEDPHQLVPIELNLWFFVNQARREKAHREVMTAVEAAGGRLLDQAIIEEIEYHGLLVAVPRAAAQEIGAKAGALATAQAIYHIRPQSISRHSRPIHERRGDTSGVPLPVSAGPALGAIIDGYPIDGHFHLKDRISVNDVDVRGEDVPVAKRYHGTAMASLIVHGDLNNPDLTPLESKVHVVPILAPGIHGGETTPEGKLPIALVYRAVLAMVKGLDGRPPQADSVVVINHSICDSEAPFTRSASYWARLLDYLSHRFRLLFVVSAGNIEAEVRLSDYATAHKFDAVDELERRALILLALRNSMGARGLLSPAEAVNVLTVGALHSDYSGDFPEGHFDPFGDLRMTNFCSAVGPGVGGGVKPDVIEAGGRQIVSTAHDHKGAYAYVNDTGLVGQLAAAPDPHGGSVRSVSMSTGTSNGAALTTRAAIRLAELLSVSYRLAGSDWSKRGGRAAQLRALVVHGASWGATGDTLDKSFPPEGKNNVVKRRKGIAGFLGFGMADHSRILAESGARATLIAEDSISAGELHEYRIPIPASMRPTRELRRMIITLAWNTPVRSTVLYREIQLDIVDEKGGKKFWKSLGNALQPSASSMAKGTVMHFVLEGSKIPRKAEAEDLFIGVQARALHKEGQIEPAHYGLVVTLELANSVRSVDLHQELEVALQARQALRERSRSKA